MRLTRQDLLDALGIPLASAADAAWADAAVDAVNAYVDALPHVAAGGWDARTRTGATMLAVRIYQSRSAAGGGAAYDVAGALVQASASPEVGRLLRIGRGYARARVG